MYKRLALTKERNLYRKKCQYTFPLESPQKSKNHPPAYQSKDP